MSDTVASLVDAAYAASLRPAQRALVVSKLKAVLKDDPAAMQEATQQIGQLSQIPTARCVITAARLSVLKEAVSG